MWEVWDRVRRVRAWFGLAVMGLPLLIGACRNRQAERTKEQIGRLEGRVAALEAELRHARAGKGRVSAAPAVKEDDLDRRLREFVGLSEEANEQILQKIKR